MDFLTELDNLIASKHMLKTPFYRAWTMGELTLPCLQEYAKEYYTHVKAFPVYLSTLHSHTKDSDMRKALLKNLVEEEGGSPNHPELWKQFAEHLGVTKIEEHTPGREVSSLVETFRQNCAHNDVSIGLASLYAYESQIPSVCVSKIDGLKAHYGLKNPEAWAYFSVHIEADVEHAKDERNFLAKHVKNEAEVLEAVDNVLEKLNAFLDSFTLLPPARPSPVRV